MNKFDVMTKYRSYLYFHLFADTFKTLMKLNICTKPLEGLDLLICMRTSSKNKKNEKKYLVKIKRVKKIFKTHEGNSPPGF